MKKIALVYFLCNTVLFLVPVMKCNAQNPQVVDSLRKEISRHTIKDSSLVRTYLNYAESITFENTDSAMKYANAALQLSQVLKWQRGIASALNQKGEIDFYKSDFVPAMNYFQQALKAGKSLHNQLFEASVYNNMANIYAELGESEKALVFFNKLLALSKETKSKKFEIIALVNIGDVYLDENKTKGLVYFKEGLAFAQDENNLEAATTCLLNIGIIFKKEKKYDSARIYLENSINMSKKINSKNIQATALGELADLYLYLGNYSKAEKYSLQSITLAKEISNLKWERDAYKALSNTYEKENKSGKALIAYKNYTTLQDSMLNGKKRDEITRMEIQFEFDKKAAVAKAINDKQQALAKAKIQKQRLVENATMAGAGFLMLICIGSFVFYKRNRDIRTQRNEAELKAQISDTEMKALRAQMNPHFIFNSLNSIADYIDKSQSELASSYTASFAKLMRMVLENSEQKEILLADDLKALELYMQLENLRLENKFDYKIIIDKNIDAENTLVPPLLLQPFVENSIWHGIAKKEQSGLIIIEIEQQGEMINCTVKDDGGGMKISTSNINNKSLGMKITKARIDVLNKTKKANASMQVYNENNGVKAELKLPLELSF